MNLDYRDLLRRYIELVVGMEGTDFLSYITPGVGFTAEELDELRRLAWPEAS